MSESEIEEAIIPVLQEATDEFARFVFDEIPDSRSLFQTVAFVPTALFNYQIVADEYFKFVDRGVNALQGDYAQKRPKVSGSPYSFRTPRVSQNFAAALQDKYRISTEHAYATAMSIKIHGIVPKNLIDRFFTAEKLEAIAGQLLEKLRLPLQIQFRR
jgi:hypothetical protein